MTLTKLHSLKGSVKNGKWNMKIETKKEQNNTKQKAGKHYSAVVHPMIRRVSIVNKGLLQASSFKAY